MGLDADSMEKQTLKQERDQKAKREGVYHIWLLFREMVPMPSQEAVLEKLRSHFGEVNALSEAVSDTKSALDKLELMSFAVPKYSVTYQDGKTMPVQVMLVECHPVEELKIADDMARTQFWDCPDGNALLDSCSYALLASDMVASGLPPLQRAELISDWLDIALTFFPQCVAVYFAPSGKLLTADSVRQNPYQGVLRFVHGGINARFFNIEGTEDQVVDTLGLYKLGLPEVQYHFHGCDPNQVVRHAYNTAIYQFENNAPIASGHTIEGFEPGEKWRCQYESSLIQPVRDVLDIEMGRHASGKRGE